MKKIAKNLFFILLFSLISCLTLYEITEAAPLKDYTQKVTTLEKRGAVKLPKEFGFTPKYYRTKTTSQVDMNQSDVTPSRVIDPPNKMIGEYYLFNFGRIGTKDKKTKELFILKIQVILVKKRSISNYHLKVFHPEWVLGLMKNLFYTLSLIKKDQRIQKSQTLPLNFLILKTDQ